MKTNNVKIQVEGILTLSAAPRSGRIRKLTVHNVITTLGLAAFAELVAGNGWTAPFSHIAIGDDATVETPADLALVNELLRATATVEQLVAPDDNKVRYVSMWDYGAAAGTYRESGIFNAATDGIMLNRATFADFVVGADDALAARWDITFQNV